MSQCCPGQRWHGVNAVLDSAGMESMQSWTALKWSQCCPLQRQLALLKQSELSKGWDRAKNYFDPSHKLDYMDNLICTMHKKTEKKFILLPTLHSWQLCFFGSKYMEGKVKKKKFAKIPVLYILYSLRLYFYYVNVHYDMYLHPYCLSYLL